MRLPLRQTAKKLDFTIVSLLVLWTIFLRFKFIFNNRFHLIFQIPFSLEKSSDEKQRDQGSHYTVILIFHFFQDTPKLIKKRLFDNCFLSLHSVGSTLLDYIGQFQAFVQCEISLAQFRLMDRLHPGNATFYCHCLSNEQLISL